MSAAVDTNNARGQQLAKTQSAKLAPWVPQTFGEMTEYVNFICKSDLVPKEMRGKPADCMLAIQLGRELGMPDAQALQSIAVINGRPTVWGDALLGIVRASGLLEQFEEDVEMGTDGLPIRAVCAVKRKGDDKVYIGEFTRAQAIKAGLWGRNVWASYPQRMIKFRARSWALRDAFGDYLKGLQSAEEAMDVADDAAPSFDGPTAADTVRQRLEIPTSIPTQPPSQAQGHPFDSGPAAPAADGCTCGAPAGKPHLKPCPIAGGATETAQARPSAGARRPDPAAEKREEEMRLIGTPGFNAKPTDKKRMLARVCELVGYEIASYDDVPASVLRQAREELEQQNAHDEAANAHTPPLLDPDAAY